MRTAIPSDLQAQLGDRYTIDREIAHGGMATVYLAHDLRHDRDVALKVMHPDVALALGRERFLREIKLTAKLSHPNILTVHDSGEAGECLWYVMPYVEGETLRERIEKNGQLPIDEAVRLTREAAEAIGYAHSLGIIHRDIKPENILLSRGHAVVADFGIARAIETATDDRLTGTGVSIGTTAYMSPEQALGEEIDASTDVWAIGCVLYEMLAGNPPFGTGGREVITRALTGRAEPVRQLRPEVSHNIEQVMSRSIARDKRERFANASELARALVSPDTGSRPMARRPSNRVVAVGGLTLAVVLAGGVMALSQRDSKPAAPHSTMSTDSIARELYQLAKAQQARRTGPGWARAIALYTQAIQRDSTFALAWADLARTANFAATRGSGIPGISDDSLIAISARASEKAIILAPDDAATWLVKARSARLLDPTDNGPRLFGVRKSLALDSTYVPAWHELGLIMQEELNDSAAIAAWMHATRLDPSDTEVLSFIALHYLWTGEYQKGMKWADSAVNLDPTYPLARDATGQLSYELGKPLESAKQYEIQAQLGGGTERGNSYIMLVRALAGHGDKAKARDWLTRAKQLMDTIHPNRHEGAYMGAALAALGDTLGAVRFMEKVEPLEDVHYQLHLKRDPGLSWLKGKWGRNLLVNK